MAPAGVSACHVLFFLFLAATEPVKSASVGVFLYIFPIPNEFSGSTDTSTGTECSVQTGTVVVCVEFGQPNGTKLTDGDIGPLHSLSMNLHRFFAWNRTQTQPVRLEFDFGGSSVLLSSVVLYFFNSPAQRIGLPTVTLEGGISVGSVNIPYIYANNDAVSESDSQLRNVSLRITTNTQNVMRLFIDFVFNDTDIDWFLLSEVEFCEGSADTNPTLEPISFQGGQSETVSLGPNSTQSSVGLSCTVAVSGSFQWTWLHNSNSLMSADHHWILTADATRSSILVIDKLSYTDEGTYSCVVNHATQTDNRSRNIVLALLTAVEAAVNQVSLMVGQDAILSCEMYGYLWGTIEWLKDGQQLQSVGRCNITTSAGSREGQNGGQSSVSSVVSQLTIQQVQEGDEGTYTCRAVGSEVQDNITVIVTVPPLVALWVVTAIVLVVLISMVAFFVTCCKLIKYRRMSPSGQWTPSAVTYNASNETATVKNPVYKTRNTEQEEERDSVNDSAQSVYCIEIHPTPAQRDQDIESMYDYIY